MQKVSQRKVELNYELGITVVTDDSQMHLLDKQDVCKLFAILILLKRSS